MRVRRIKTAAKLFRSRWQPCSPVTPVHRSSRQPSKNGWLDLALTRVLRGTDLGHSPGGGGMPPGTEISRVAAVAADSRKNAAFPSLRPAPPDPYRTRPGCLRTRRGRRHGYSSAPGSPVRRQRGSSGIAMPAGYLSAMHLLLRSCRPDSLFDSLRRCRDHGGVTVAVENDGGTRPGRQRPAADRSP